MALEQLFSRVKHRVWSNTNLILLERPAGKPVKEYTKEFPGELRPVTQENIYDCGDFEDAATRVPIYKRFIENGNYMVYGYLNGKCVYRNVAFLNGSLSHEGCVIRSFSGKDGEIGYNFCAPEARGNGFGQVSILHFFEKFFDHTFYALIRPQNYPALKNAIVSGYELKSMITVRNRFLSSRLSEVELTPNEIKDILKTLSLPFEEG